LQLNLICKNDCITAAEILRWLIMQLLVDSTFADFDTVALFFSMVKLHVTGRKRKFAVAKNRTI